MHINCQKEDLLYGVQAVSRAVSNKNTLPIYSGIMILARGSNLIFRATDAEIAIECVINADVITEGDVVVPGKYFSELVRYLPNGLISFESLNEVQLMIRYDESQITVNCLPSEDFPQIIEVEGDISGHISPLVFRRMVKEVSVAVANDEIRPVFSGIFCELKQDQLLMVATDTHRLALSKGVWQGEGEGSLILPNRTMQEIARLSINDEDPFQIIVGKSQVSFSFSNITFVSRIISGQYPDYKQVLPKEEMFISHAILNRQRLLEALERAMLLSRDISRNKGNIVNLRWKNDQILMTADVPDVGRIKETMSTELEGEEMESNYNTKYLIDALKILDEEKIKIKLTGKNTPAIIAPMDEDNYIYLILPVRVAN